MKYTKDIKRVQKMISDLTQVEDAVLGIEQEVTDIDNALPGDTEFAAMADGPEKQELSRLFDLNDEAYDLIDEILGPPEEEISVEEMLRQFPSARKGQAN